MYLYFITLNKQISKLYYSTIPKFNFRLPVKNKTTNQSQSKLELHSQVRACKRKQSCLHSYLTTFVKSYISNSCLSLIPLPCWLVIFPLIFGSNGVYLKHQFLNHSSIILSIQVYCFEVLAQENSNQSWPFTYIKSVPLKIAFTAVFQN